VSEEPFRPEDGGELRSDTLDVEQHRRRRCDLLRGKQHVPLGLHRLDLLEQQLQPIEFTANLRLQVIRQQATIAGLKRIQPLPSVAAQRLVARYPL
jgi:heme oxygenase